jgi:F0F1-type ATP synthase assembly protein I
VSGSNEPARDVTGSGDAAQEHREPRENTGPSESPASLGLPPLPELPVFPEIPKRAVTPAVSKDSGLSGLSVGYALATEFLVYLGVCAALGWAVDRYVVGGGQVWTVVGAALGLIGGVYRMIRGSNSYDARANGRGKSGRGER